MKKSHLGKWFNAQTERYSDRKRKGNNMKQKTIWLKTKVTLEFNDDAPGEDVEGFIEFLVSEIRLNRTQRSPKLSIKSTSDGTNVIR